MPAIPLIGMGISAYSAYKQAKSAQKAGQAQERIAQQQSDLGRALQTAGRGQMAAGEPALNKAMQHYMTLVTGNRGAINAEIAPERNQMLEGYRGAETGINAKLAPGPDRDRAIAELYRSKAGQAGMMPFQARQNAFQNLESAGEKRLSVGADLMKSSSGVFGGASDAAARAGENNADAWAGYGSIGANASKAAQGVWDWYKNRRGGSQPGPWSGGYKFPSGGMF